MHSISTSPRRLAAIVVFLGLGLGFARQASAQELVSAEVYSMLPALMVGSSALGFDRPSLAIEARAPRFAVCDPSGDDCEDLHPYQIHMTIFPRWKLQLRLPRDFALHGHLWSMSHDEVDLSMRQAIVGGTVRKKWGPRWVELGAGFAQRAVALRDNDATDGDASAGADTSGDVGRLGMALLAGAGVWLPAGEHMLFDLRLRGGLGVGERGEGVYSANLVVAFTWQ